MTEDDDTGGWRRATRHVLSGWPYIVAALAVSLSAYGAGAKPGFAAALFIMFFALILLRRSPPVEGRIATTSSSEVEPLASDPSPQIAAVIDALDLPIFVMGREADLLAQNRAAEKAFGALAVGAHISARWRSPGILDMVRETIATGEPNQIEHSERLPSERVYVVRIAPVSLRDPPAQPVTVQTGATQTGEAMDMAGYARFFLLSFKDISDLRRLDQMRSDFVANASHELRTPLASLRGFIETMQGPAKDDLKAKERFLSIMLDQANRMSRLVDDLLSLSRLELKAHLAPDRMVDLVPVLGHVRDSLAPLASDLNVDIRLQVPDGKVEVLGDRDELVQVFENLIENACKYGQDGQFIEVTVRHEAGGSAEVSVRDHGPGIPAEHVPRLTERFYRVSVEDSRSKKGTGLGLAIVKHILTRHRARLIVKSELGKGTDFTVRF